MSSANDKPQDWFFGSLSDVFTYPITRFELTGEVNDAGEFIAKEVPLTPDQQAHQDKVMKLWGVDDTKEEQAP